MFGLDPAAVDALVSFVNIGLALLLGYLFGSTRSPSREATWATGAAVGYLTARYGTDDSRDEFEDAFFYNVGITPAEAAERVTKEAPDAPLDFDASRFADDGLDFDRDRAD